MKDYLSQLDDSQREAVLYDTGPSLVVAGAGSGKTRVLTYKIVHLLQTGYQPHTILALTFTNKAAREMKNRIALLINEYSTRYLWMGTFHSIFYRILRREAQYIGYPSDFTIYDQEDSRNLIKSIAKELKLDDKVYRPGLIQSRISKVKNDLVTSDAYSSNSQFIKEDNRNNVPRIGEIYKWYRDRCFQAGAMDFDDLLLYTNLLFNNHPDVLAKYQNQFRYVLVDEYQDTNYAQHLIVSHLCKQHQHVFAVGDDAQSIYSFRGANIDNMLRFKDRFPGCRVFKLEQNYRSTQTIVDAANSVITKNKNQIKKTVYSKKETGNKMLLLSAYSDYDESYLVSCKISEMMQTKDYAFSDFAVLYRTNAQSRMFEESFRKRMINYRIYGSQSFYQRKEIKDSLAYMRVIINPKDEEALKRIINYPLRGIGKTTVDKLQQVALSAQVGLWDVIGSPDSYQMAISRGTVEKIMHFRNLMDEMQRFNQEMTAGEIGEIVVKMSGIYGLLMEDKSIENISRLENINELLHAMQDFVASGKEEGLDTVSLSDFLMEASLMTDQDNDKDEHADKVTLMTVHAAKGLEFKNVFIAGMENDLFPSSQSMSNPKAIEEERRLFYVAITRAKENCIITYAGNRYRNGEKQETSPSFFLDDIDEKYLDYADDTELPSNRRMSYASSYSGYEKSYGNFQRKNTSDRNPAWDTDDSLKYAKKAIHPSWDSKETSKRLHQAASRSFGSDDSLITRQVKNVTSLAGFTVGDKVLHDRFGAGVITTLENNEGDAKATVDFDNTGRKILLLKYAKLKKMTNN